MIFAIKSQRQRLIFIKDKEIVIHSFENQVFYNSFIKYEINKEQDNQRVKVQIETKNIFNAKKLGLYTELRTPDSVRCLFELKNGYLASSGWDKTIKLWNIENGELIKTLEGHSNYVRCLI